jgi:hypothetical protein
LKCAAIPQLSQQSPFQRIRGFPLISVRPFATTKLYLLIIAKNDALGKPFENNVLSVSFGLRQRHDAIRTRGGSHAACFGREYNPAERQMDSCISPNVPKICNSSYWAAIVRPLGGLVARGLMRVGRSTVLYGSALRSRTRRTLDGHTGSKTFEEPKPLAWRSLSQRRLSQRRPRLLLLQPPSANRGRSRG